MASWLTEKLALAAGMAVGAFFASTLGTLSLVTRFLRSPRKFFVRTDRSAVIAKYSTVGGQHDFVEANGVKFHCVSRGSPGAPLMLFLHGFPQCWFSWRFQMEEFSNNYNCVAIDLKGFGLSDKPAGIAPYHVNAHMHDLKALIPALGYQKCVLVGHDWGAVLAWNFAIHFPQMLHKLVIVNVPHPATFARNFSFKQFLKSWYMYVNQLPVVPEIMWFAGDYSIYDLFKMKRRQFTAEETEVYKAWMSIEGAGTASINYYRNILRRSKAPRPSTHKPTDKITVPTLFLWGEDDVALEKNLTRGTDQFVQDLTLITIPNCSHFANEDAPDVVNSHMREFLARA